MSRAPRGEGVRVGGGRLRVDAARAVTKLREYQLPDPTLWTLEVVRAAVLLGASALYVEADADDVWIGWDGPPLSTEDLTGLFDDLVSASGGERRGQRLLAMGVNTALALEPRFVDVYAIDGAEAQRTRYTPQLLVASEEGHSDALRSLLAERMPRPDWVLSLSRGSAVHVRRALSLETMARALRMDVPPEVHRVLAAANALSIPIHAKPRPTPPPPPLIRVALGPGTAHPHLRGHAEITAVEHAGIHARLVWSELGVMLAAEALAVSGAQAGRRMPLVVQLDHDRLPTNAARSAVREGEPAIEDARRDALAVAKGLASTLAEHLTDALARGDFGRHYALRAAAIAIVHAQDDAGDGWQVFVRKAPRDAWYACLLDVPVSRDVLGEPRSLRELADANRDVVHRGDAPVRTELAPWVRGIPWAPPGDPLHRLYGDAVAKDATSVIASAARRAAARIRFLSHPEVELSPAMGEADLAACALPTGIEGESWVPAEALGWIEGRVVLGALRPLQTVLEHGVERRERAEIVVLWQRRVLHRTSVPCELPLRVWLSDERLQPNPEYTGLTDQDAFERAIEAAMWAGVHAAERLANRASAPSAPSRCTLGPGASTITDESIEATLRAAQRLALRLTSTGASKKRADAIRSLVVRPGPLRTALLFRPFEGAARSLAELQDVAHERGVLGTASRRPTFGLGDRVILDLRGADALALGDLLSARLGPAPQRHSKKGRARAEAPPGDVALPLKVAIVSYGDELAIRQRTDPSELASAFRGARAILRHEEPSFRAALALLPEGEGARVDLFHARRRIGKPRTFRDMHLPVALAIDDDALVPTPGFEDVVGELEGRGYDAVAWSERLAVALADYLLGAPTPMVSVFEHDRGRLLIALAELLPDDYQRARAPADPLEGRRAGLRALAIVPSLSGIRVPLDRLLLAGASKLPFVDPDTARKVGPLHGFEAAVLYRREADALGRFFLIALDDRSVAAQERFVEERRKHAEAMFLQRPVERVDPPKDAVAVSGAELSNGSARAVESYRARTIITCRGRRVVEHLGSDAGRALEVRVDVDMSLVDLDAMDLTPAGASRVKGATRDAGRRLLAQMLADDPARLGRDPAWVSVAFAFIDELPRKRTATRQALLDSLLEAAFVPALDGKLVSIREALRAPENEVLFARELEGWLGPAQGQKPHALDRAPILAFPGEVQGQEGELQRLVQGLVATVGKLRDVSKEARRLRDARKVARGGGGDARLPPHVDRRFVVSLRTLAQRSQSSDTLLEVFPQGEAALLDGGASRLVLIDQAGEQVRTYSFVPPVFVVARSPYAQELDDDEAARTVEAAMRTVVAEVLRWTIDTVPSSTWTPAIRKVIRGAALLGGPTHLDRISTAAIFPTTTGAFLTYDELRAQVNAFAVLWTVLEPVPDLPLDPQRRVLVLAEHERARLHALLPTTDGAAELALDTQARRNLARPAVSDIAPSSDQRQVALGMRRLELTEGELWVLPLHPSAAGARGLTTFRARKPLGPAEDRCRWPTLCRADAPKLSPDRVHGAPQQDAVLHAIERAAREASEAVLAERFGAPSRPGEFSYVVTDEVSHAVFPGRNVEVRGRLEWSGLGDPLRARVHVEDARGSSEARLHATPPKSLMPVALPLTGELWVSGTSYLELPPTQLDGLARRAYIAMLLEAASAWQASQGPAEAGELALAMLVQAATGFGLGGLKGKWQNVELGFVRSGARDRSSAGRARPGAEHAGRDLKSLAQACSEAATVFSLAPSELEVLDQLPAGALVLLRDESLASRVAHTMLADRVQSLREWIEAREAPEPAPPASPPTQRGKPQKAGKHVAPAPRPAASPSAPRAIDVMIRRVAVLARAVKRDLPPLQLQEHRRGPTLVAGDLVVTDEPLLRAAAAVPDRWPSALPLLAAETLTVVRAGDETTLVASLLDALGTE